MKFWFSTLLILLSVRISYAQTTTPDSSAMTLPLYVGNRIFPNETQWSADSTRLIFEDAAYDTVHLFEFNLTTNILSEVEHASLTVVLTEDQQEQFGAIVPTASISPNEQYIVYETDEDVCGESGCINGLALGDLISGASVRIQTYHAGNRSIRWNLASNAFLMIDIGDYGVGGVKYAGNFQDLSSDIVPIMLINYPNGSDATFDLSSDGERVLLPELQDGFETGFILWDAIEPSSGQQFSATDGNIYLEDMNIAGAMFLPTDDSVLLIVTDDGIMRYNLETQEMTLVNPSINAVWAYWVYFSPDAQYAATLSSSEGGFPCQVFVMSVENFDFMTQPDPTNYPCLNR